MICGAHPCILTIAKAFGLEAGTCLVSLCWFVGRMVFEHGLEAHGTHGQDGRATTKIFERRLRWGWRWDAGWKPTTRAG